MRPILILLLLLPLINLCHCILGIDNFISFGAEALKWAGFVPFFYSAYEYFKPAPREMEQPVWEEHQTPIRRCSVHHNSAERLEALMEAVVFGQHIAETYVLAAVRGHIEDSNPSHALSIVMAGTTGTGKNYVSSIIGQAVFGDKDAMEHVHIYSGRSHFPNPELVYAYQQQLQQEVVAAVTACEHSIFIFDEIDKMPAGVIDVLKSYMDYNSHVRGIDFRKAIFVFLTNVGGKEINTKYRLLREQGILREATKPSDFERHLRKALYQGEGMFAGSDIISAYLIGYFVPFLPLERKHVTECIKFGMGMYEIPESETSRVIENVMEKMDFWLDEYSLSGCKRVMDHVKVEKHVKTKTIRP